MQPSQCNLLVGYLLRLHHKQEIQKLLFCIVFSDFDFSREKLIAIAIYLGAGLLLGFLLKRFFKYVLFLIAIIIAMYFLQKSGVIDIGIKWNTMQELVGIKTMPTVDENLFWSYWAWVKENIAISVSFLLGFIIGWKIS